MPLHLPPLRERKMDIMGFVDSTLSELEKRYGRYIKLTQDAQNFLSRYDWPGNLLEIDAVISRAYIHSESYYLNATDIEACIDHTSVACPCESDADRAEKTMPSEEKARIIAALHKYHGSRKLAAAELGISVSTLWRRMKTCRILKSEGKQPLNFN